MSKTVVMTLRLPTKVARGVEGLARRSGHKPAQLGVRLVEEGLRRRDYPQIDLRETAAGRVAYVGGTRFAVYWVVQAIRNGMTPEQFAGQYGLPRQRIRAALAYAEDFPEEINADLEHAEANQKWLSIKELFPICCACGPPKTVLIPALSLETKTRSDRTGRAPWRQPSRC